MKFRKLPSEIEAYQWFKIGDHSDNEKGQVVPCCRGVVGGDPCPKCGIELSEHGVLEVPDGEYRICPGDWIVPDIMGEYSPCEDKIFRITHEPVDSDWPIER